MTVGDPSINERFRESISVELRIRPRARDRAHIDEQIHGHLPEQSHKFFDRARRMAYREDCRHRLGLSHTEFSSAIARINALIIPSTLYAALPD